MPALRCLAVGLLAIALAPATAHANATVEQQSNSLNITVIGDDSPDDITVTQTGGTTPEHVFIGSGLSSFSCSTDMVGDIHCPLGTSIAVDLGGGNDTFTTQSEVTVPVSIAGGAGDDHLTGGSANDTLAGGADNDTLTGARGSDSYFGEGGNDTIFARDGRPERISCGTGIDTADNDFTDILAECERGIDNDRDGFSSAVDCNDANPSVHPGAPEIFGNGVDENCDGRDNVDVDKDNDGFPIPVDCNDRNRRIHPGAREIRGNKVDENCDRRAEPFAQLAAVVSTSWLAGPTFTQLRKLVVHNASRGTKIVMRCKGGGCPIHRARRRTVRRSLRPVVMHRGFPGAKLRPGARVTLQLTAKGAIGRTYRYTVARGALPTSTTVCRAPGAKKGRAC